VTKEGLADFHRHTPPTSRRTEAIYLAGLPDVPESRLHPAVNEQRFG